MYRCPHPSIRPRSGASAPQSAGLDHGDRAVLVAGRYRLRELAGHGATALVWRGHDKLLDREVAVKQFRDRRPHDVAEATWRPKFVIPTWPPCMTWSSTAGRTAW